MKKTAYILFLSAIILLSGCEKQDPFVDRVVSPLLFLVVDDNGVQSNGTTTDPTVSTKISKDVTFNIKLLELDKTNILDHTKGIDSIAVKSLKVTLSLRTGTKIGELTTGNDGKATLTKTWADLGVASPKAGTTVLLSWSGTYKDVAFTKYTRIQGSN
ncbi:MULTISPECIES: hypothetical protein [Emticicia]|uniref:hypothetical protein n=1 Tax=Emticicia TaxID=312278 RepID=UPI00209F2CEE|nr:MULTISPECIES: hypothetical protein [Emticicia]UTA70247.1 hypothetical protein MB380_10570 [Emticicia sp. 21SJ11W-3]